MNAATSSGRRRQTDQVEVSAANQRAAVGLGTDRCGLSGEFRENKRIDLSAEHCGRSFNPRKGRARDRLEGPVPGSSIR